MSSYQNLWIEVSPILVQKRGMARLGRSTRRTTVDDRTETGTEYPLAERREAEEQERMHAYGKEGLGDDETQEAALTPDVRRHLTKVYGTMMAGLGFAAAGALAAGVAPVLAPIGLIGSFVGVLGLVFTDRRKVTLRQNLFLGVGGLTGMGLAPLLAASAPGVVFAAALGTSAIFGGFTLAALRAKRRSMLTLGGPLIGGLMFVFAASLSTLLLPLLGVTSPAILGALHSVSLYGGLALFSLFISYDTQVMIESYHAGDNDHITPALNMFLNVINIFVRLLQIFRGGD